VTEDDDSYAISKGLLLTDGVAGVEAHDARLVTVTLAHGISTIVTLNVQGFPPVSRHFGRPTARCLKSLLACPRTLWAAFLSHCKSR
jgi:hypothetical protein